MAGSAANAININTPGVTYFNGPDFGSITNGTTGQVLTANVSGAPTFQDSSSSGIVNITGDSGTATGTTVTIKCAQSSLGCGETLKFTGSLSTLLLNVSDSGGSTVVGSGAGNIAGSPGTQVTVLGHNSGTSLSGSSGTTIIGGSSGTSITSGINNTIVGQASVTSLQSGNHNTILGQLNGNTYTTSESSNILINSTGIIADNNTLRLGQATGTSNQELSKAFISGINGNTVSNTKMVTIDSTTDQLGTAPFSTDGTFTPVLAFGGASVGISGSLLGEYTQIGNIVFVTVSISLISKGTSTGSATLRGFPVSMTSVSSTNILTVMSYADMNLTGDTLIFLTGTTGTTFGWMSNGSDSSPNLLTNASFSDSSIIQFTGFYFSS